MGIPHSGISYATHSGGDANFVLGCTPVSEGCRNCYALALLRRYKRSTEVRVDPDKLGRLVGWGSRGRFGLPTGMRPRVFVCDMGDLFHEDVPDSVIDRAVRTFNLRDDVDWLVLTKRPQRMLDWWSGTGEYLGGNIWLGVTAENQAMADERIPLLLQMPATVRWVSVEPMLEAMDLTPYLWLTGASTAGPWYDALGRYRGGGGVGGQMVSSNPSHDIHLVICGGESGRDRRPFDVAWALDLHRQCQEAGVPFWYKQGSALKPGQDDDLPGVGLVRQLPGVQQNARVEV